MDRTPRNAEARSEKARPKPWAPPRALEAPVAPEGYVYRWVRHGIMGAEDSTSLHARLREGWQPVMASEHPEFSSPTITEGKYDGVIGTGGLILCKIPVETVEQRTAYYGDRSRDQMQAVDRTLREAERGYNTPIDVQRRSQVSVGRGVNPG